MTKAETRAVMNYELRDTKQFDEDSDRYMDLNIRLDFDDDDRLEAVEFLGLEEGFYEVRYNGKKIYPLTEKKFFAVMDKNLFQKNEYGNYYTSYELNLSIGWDNDTDTLSVGRLDYYRDADAELEFHEKLMETSFKLTKGMDREETRKIMAADYDVSPDGRRDIYPGRISVIFYDNNKMEEVKWWS